MYAIFCKVPRFDNRDGFAGYTVFREPTRPNVYETLALALAMRPSGYDADGQANENEYFVANLADTYPTPITPASDYADWEDIEF